VEEKRHAITGLDNRRRPRIHRRRRREGQGEPARTWKVTSSVSKGVKAPPEEIFLIFRGDAILIREDGKTAENFSYALDPSKKPKEIDVTLKVGAQTAGSIAASTRSTATP